MKNGKNPFKVGDVVTWGSGAARARIAEFTLFDTGLEAHVLLVAPASGPCGRDFPVGTPATFPIDELRHVS